MGELGLVARLRSRLSLKRKVKGESFTNNGIVTKTLPKRSEGNSTNAESVSKVSEGGRNGKAYAKHWLTVVVLFLAAACVTLLVLLQQANAEVGYYFWLLASVAVSEKKQAKYRSLTVALYHYGLLVNKPNLG